MLAYGVVTLDPPVSPTSTDFDLDTMDISAEASRAAAMLGPAHQAATPGTCVQRRIVSAAFICFLLSNVYRIADLPFRCGKIAVPSGAGRTASSTAPTVAGTPTTSVLEVHVQMLTNKLAEAEANNQRLQVRIGDWGGSGSVHTERNTFLFIVWNPFWCSANAYCSSSAPQDENNMLRDQLSTLQFQSNMTVRAWVPGP